MLLNGDWGISYGIALRWMPLNLTDDKSTLVQVMAWCRQVTSRYLIQCWPSSMSPYGITRPQWVKMRDCFNAVGQFILSFEYWCSLVLTLWRDGFLVIDLSGCIVSIFAVFSFSLPWFLSAFIHVHLNIYTHAHTYTRVYAYTGIHIII